MNTGKARAVLQGTLCEGHPTLSSISVGDVPDMMFGVQVNGKPAIAFVNPGASNLFMSRETAAKFDLDAEEHNAVDVELGDGSFISSSDTASISITFGDQASTEDFHIVSMTSLYRGKPYIVVGLSQRQPSN